MVINGEPIFEYVESDKRTSSSDWKSGLYLNRETGGPCFRCIFSCTYHAMHMMAWTHHHSNGMSCLLPPDVRMQVHNDSICLMTTVHADQQFSIIVNYCNSSFPHKCYAKHNYDLLWLYMYDFGLWSYLREQG